MAVWWLTVKLAAKHSRFGKVWLQHCVGPAWTQPQHSALAFTAPTAVPPSGFLAPCLGLPAHSMEHRGKRTSWGVSEHLCGEQAISSTLPTCGKVIHRVLTVDF